MRNCIKQNRLFNIRIRSIIITTTVIENVVINRDDDHSFINLNGGEIIIEDLSIIDLIDLN